MSDYIKREDAVFIVLQQPMIGTSAVTEMRQLPGIDIVRCKECKYQCVITDEDEGTSYYECGVWATATDEWIFCSHGKRREP